MQTTTVTASVDFLGFVRVQQPDATPETVGFCDPHPRPVQTLLDEADDALSHAGYRRSDAWSTRRTGHVATLTRDLSCAIDRAPRSHLGHLRPDVQTGTCPVCGMGRYWVVGVPVWHHQLGGLLACDPTDIATHAERLARSAAERQQRDAEAAAFHARYETVHAAAQRTDKD